MICPICGTKNKEDAVRCSKCNLILVPNKVREKMEAAAKTENVKKASSYAVPHSLSDGRYLIVKKLGAGGMSRVLLARDKKMDCYVVIKELLPFFEFDDLNEADYLENRFMCEAKLLYRLDDKGLPKVMDYFAEQERLYFVMQFIDGQTLADYVAKKENNQISLEECFKWMKDIIDILIYLHNQNPPILHRDVKPHNIMLDKTGKIFLVDFGIAREVKGTSSTGTSVGTYGYASPEHFTGKYEISSDLYCLGATFHMLLSGEDPRERPPFKFYPLSNYRDDIPPRLEEIFDRMVEMDTKKRYQTTKALKADLISFITEYYGKDITGSSELEIAEIAAASRRARKARAEAAAEEENDDDYDDDDDDEEEVDSPTDVIKAGTEGEPKRVEAGLMKGKKSKSSQKAGLFKSRKGKKRKKTNDSEGDEIIVGGRNSNGETSVGKSTATMERKPVSSIKKKKSSVLSIALTVVFGLIFLVGISYVLFVRVLKLDLPIFNIGKERYSVSISSRSEKVIFQIKKEIGNQYQYKTTKERNFIKKKSGFRVVQKFNTEKAARTYAEYLQKKDQPANVVKDSPDEIYVQIGGIYSNSNEAARQAKYASGIMKTRFEVQDNFLKLPYTTYRLEFSGIANKKDAEELKARLETQKPDEVVINKYILDEQK